MPKVLPTSFPLVMKKLVRNMRNMEHVHSVDIWKKLRWLIRDIRRGSTTRRQLAEFVKIFGALLSAFVHATESRLRLFVAHTS